ncbi:hypothetical protein ZIOFF_041683 [Zingiber officinale]|uniref:Uncharacterized protein n=1 Tax=Zingiber officinale TaxID=94328 RepID=A0A8J5GE80_ZINOF|nr:hypothetical protein ZIOFF_041683 [Zingiber officinale]
MCLKVSVQVTKRVDTEEKDWSKWNWRTEGDVMANGAFFVASGAGAGVEAKYAMAESVDPKSAALIDQLTMNAGVLGGASRECPLPSQQLMMTTEDEKGGELGDDLTIVVVAQGPQVRGAAAELITTSCLRRSEGMEDRQPKSD